VARKAASSPATGFNKIHKIEQEDLVNKAFKL
jgi:2-oxoglutarate dehydrogenase E1 component